MRRNKRTGIVYPILTFVLCLTVYIFHFRWTSNFENNLFDIKESSHEDVSRSFHPKFPIPTDIPIQSQNAITITGDKYEPGFSINGSSICPKYGEDLDIVILVTSATYHFAHRNAIRLTWGSFSKRRGISIGFLLGKTFNSSINEMIEREHFLYDDIIKANSIDSYYNLTLKSLSAFEWAHTYCNKCKFVLKTDDDVFINMPKLITFISKLKKGGDVEPTIYGSLAKNWEPFRDKLSKYYISYEEFAGKFYPDFTLGPAYLFNPFIGQILLTKALRKPYLKLEDVFLTGVVAEEANIKRVDVYEFGSEELKLIKNTELCILLELISIHQLTYHQQFDMWKHLSDNRPGNCSSSTSMYESEITSLQGWDK